MRLRCYGGCALNVRGVPYRAEDQNHPPIVCLLGCERQVSALPCGKSLCPLRGCVTYVSSGAPSYLG